MNDEVEGKEVIKIDGPDEKSKSNRKSNFGSWLAILLSLSAVGLAAWGYVKMGANSLASNIAPIEAKLSKLESNLADSREEKQQLQNQIASVEQQQLELSDNLNKLFRQQDMGNGDWALAEVEHLLIVASHLIALQRDVPTALAAMAAADDRLKNNNDPGLLGVRQQLKGDINALNAVEAVDIAGLALFLSDLVGRASELPLKQVKVNHGTGSLSEIEAYGNNWEKLFSSIWQELKSLVQISRHGEQTIATLMPEQEYFLYQNLRLQLESARYAVLRRDTENLHVSTGIIASWLNDYFDIRDNAVANIIESLSQMSVLELNPVLPDISSSLESLRAYVKAQDLPMGLDQDVEESVSETQALEQEP